MGAHHQTNTPSQRDAANSEPYSFEPGKRHPFKLTDNQVCMLKELRIATGRPDTENALYETLTDVSIGTEIINNFPAAVEEGHRQLREESGLIRNSHCKIPKTSNSPAR